MITWTNKQFKYTNEISDLIKNTKLTDLRCKHVDLTTNKITVIDVNNSVRQSLEDIEGAIRSAVNRVRRSTPNLMVLNYTVKDFIMDNMLLLRNENIAEMRKEGE